MMREVDFGLIHAELDSGGGKNKPKLAISKSQVVNASSGDDGVLQIKISNEITNATYAIQSKDLIINFADDHEILILKYLSQARVPSLVSDTGRFISRETIFTLTRFEHNTAAVPAVAGAVVAITGKAYVKRISGLKGELAENDEIYQGDYIATPRGGEIHIRLADGSEYKIGQEARVTIDKFAYSQKPDLQRSVVSVLQGVVSFISGEIAKHPAGEAILNTPVAILSLKGEISGGWQVDEEGGHKFFAECPGESCNGRVEIQTLAGDRSLYQPNILISVENMLKMPVQLTNLDNPKAISMGEAVGLIPAEEAPVQEEVQEVIAVEEVAVQQEEEAPAAELNADGDFVDEPVIEAVKVEEKADQIPVLDFFSAASEAIAEENTVENKVEPEVEALEVNAAPEEETIIAENVADEPEEIQAVQSEESVVIEEEEPVAEEVVVEEVVAAPVEVSEVVIEPAANESEEVLHASDDQEAQIAAPQDEVADIEEQPALPSNVITLSSTGEKLVNGRAVQGDNQYINGHGKSSDANHDPYFHPEKFVEFKGIDYEKLRFEKSGDGDDLVIKVINGSQDTGHMIVLKGFFGKGESHTSFEISGAGIVQHKVN